MTRITDIVDNRAAEGFESEHGLSLWIEHGAERILFDAGAGGALLPNAERLGIDLASATRIVFSHGHYDHTGGLARLSPRCPVHVGTRFFAPCFSRHEDGSVHDISCPDASSAVLGAYQAIVDDAPSEIAPGVFLSGPIARASGEDYAKSFYSEEACRTPNRVPEEHALLTGDGVLVTGCCHAGIVNTVESVRASFPKVRIRVVVGGLHLLHASRDEVGRTADFLNTLGLERLVILHCTGDEAGGLLMKLVGCPSAWGRAGERLV